MDAARVQAKRSRASVIQSLEKLETRHLTEREQYDEEIKRLRNLETTHATEREQYDEDVRRLQTSVAEWMDICQPLLDAYAKPREDAGLQTSNEQLKRYLEYGLKVTDLVLEHLVENLDRTITPIDTWPSFTYLTDEMQMLIQRDRDLQGVFQTARQIFPETDLQGGQWDGMRMGHFVELALAHLNSVVNRPVASE